MTPREVIALCREKEVKVANLRFCDLFGTWQHFSVPVERLDEDVFEEGLGFDGSSLRGWQTINESDMLAVPQPDTAFVELFSTVPTLNLICNILDPITGDHYTRDPRHIARKAANYLKASSVADTAYFGPEAEFFVFDDARFDQSSREGFYHLDSSEGAAASFSHKRRYQEGSFPGSPGDCLQNIRSEMMQAMIECGLEVESHHRKVATAGQCEIDFAFQPLVKMGDWIMLYKYIVRHVARKHGKTATFMPKPLYGDNGSGMHVHFSFWKNGNPLFAGGGYAGLSEVALHAIGGVLRHAPALLALTNPTTNSYKRLTPGFDAPVHLAYSQRNRSAACRIPMYSQNPKAKRVEFRCPDPSGNPYLTFAAITMAALDGIQNKLSPGQPLDKNLYDAPTEELGRIPHTPASLDQALRALEEDHEFLLRDDVFTPDVLETWISYKRKHEVEAMRLRPHPYEFCLYFDA